MTTKHRTKGFVFKKTDRMEADKSFSVFTSDFGRIEIVGKAIRKINSKLKSGIDTFYFSEVEFIQGKHYKTLTDAYAIGKGKTGNFEIMSRISDILDRFIKGQEKDELLFSLLEEVFEKLNDSKKRDLIYYYFVWNFLSLQGYGFQTHECASCHGKIVSDNIYFSNKIGGMICAECISKDKHCLRINADIVKILRIFLEKNWDILLRLKVGQSSQDLLGMVSNDAISAFCPS
jgi:DNA repair protein RecO